MLEEPAEVRDLGIKPLATAPLTEPSANGVTVT